VLALACRTGTPPWAWVPDWEVDDRDLFTAIELINEADRDADPNDDRVYEG
jgi:hypothetical protein